MKFTAELWCYDHSWDCSFAIIVICRRLLGIGLHFLNDVSMIRRISKALYLSLDLGLYSQLGLRFNLDLDRKIFHTKTALKLLYNCSETALKLL